MHKFFLTQGKTQCKIVIIKQKGANIVKLHRLNCQIPESIYKRVGKVAVDKDITVTDYIITALINQLESDGDYEIRDLYEGECLE